MSDQVEFVEDEQKPVVKKGQDEVTAVFDGDITTDPEAIVKLTQVVRTGMLREITDHGRILPTDTDGVSMTLSILKDMDHTALTTSKLAIEDKKANSAAQVASVADQILSKLALGKAQGPSRVMEETFELPPVEMVDGEDTQGESSLNPDDWLKDRD